MKKNSIIQAALIFLGAALSFQSVAAKRDIQFENRDVSVWKTTIPSGHAEKLVMHHHVHDRVVIALTDGALKVVSDKGNVHYLKLKKDHAYYLSKDSANEEHTDENMGHQAVEVIVVELKK